MDLIVVDVLDVGRVMVVGGVEGIDEGNQRGKVEREGREIRERKQMEKKEFDF